MLPRPFGARPKSWTRREVLQQAPRADASVGSRITSSTHSCSNSDAVIQMPSYGVAPPPPLAALARSSRRLSRFSSHSDTIPPSHGQQIITQQSLTATLGPVFACVGGLSDGERVATSAGSGRTTPLEVKNAVASAAVHRSLHGKETLRAGGSLTVGICYDWASVSHFILDTQLVGH